MSFNVSTVAGNKVTKTVSEDKTVQKKREEEKTVAMRKTISTRELPFLLPGQKVL